MNNILKLGGKKLGKEDWTFYSMDNEPLFINNEHKVKWYLKRNLIEIIGERKVKFLYEIKGKSASNDPFLLSPIEKKCVICGNENNLQKHHVIPHMYRKFMPDEYKSNNHHDVVIMCNDHHFYYEKKYSDKMKNELALKHNVKTIQDLGKERIQILKPHYLSKQKCKTLKNFNIKIPIQSIIKLSQYIIENTPPLKHYNDIILTEKEINIALKYHNNIINNFIKFDYVGLHHGKKIIEQYENLYDFIVLWRKDFIENMKPQFLPIGWDIYRDVKKIKLL